MAYSIIQKSQLEGAHRLDAEYYQPEYLEVHKKINSLGFEVKLLREIVTRPVITGSTPKSRDCKDDSTNIKFIKTDTLREGEIVFENADCLPIKSSRKHSEPQAGDVLVTIIGATHDIVGRAAMVFKDYPRININQNIALIRINPNLVLPSFLEAFLRGKFGRDQLWQQSRQTEQVNLNCREVEFVKIHVLPLGLQKNIDNTINLSRKLKNDSLILYQQAEDLLLEELGLKDFQVEDDLSFVVNLSDIKSANRIDADYFQPKYQKLISKIELKDAKRLEDFVEDYSTGFPFKSENYQEDGIPLIRINNIKKGFIDLNDTAYLSDRDYSLSPKDTARPGDIVLSMSGTIGMSAVIPVDVPKCSVNQRILKFSSKNIDRDYLVLILNSIVGAFQLERIGTGGVQTNISYRDIQNILIPVLPKTTQQKIANLVRKSHEARKKSKELLEEAKRKVEELIERGSIKES